MLQFLIGNLRHIRVRLIFVTIFASIECHVATLTQSHRKREQPPRETDHKKDPQHGHKKDPQQALST